MSSNSRTVGAIKPRRRPELRSRASCWRRIGSDVPRKNLPSEEKVQSLEVQIEGKSRQSVWGNAGWSNWGWSSSWQASRTWKAEGLGGRTEAPGEPRAVDEQKAVEKAVLVRTPTSDKPLYTATMVAPVETVATEVVSGGGGPTTPPGCGSRSPAALYAAAGRPLGGSGPGPGDDDPKRRGGWKLCAKPL